jgi:hypothetical protein
MKRFGATTWRRRLLPIAALAAFLTVVSSASAAVTANYDSGMLSVTSDAGDSITIVCESGKVKVNGNDPETDPPGSTVDCAVVEYVRCREDRGRMTSIWPELRRPASSR